jgi:hypothetical protein
MEIEVHQRGGVLGLDRRYLVKDGKIEVIDGGLSRGAKHLDPRQAQRIDQLAAHAAGATPVPSQSRPGSDAMKTDISIQADGVKRLLELQTGDDAPNEVWDLIGEVSRASAG